MPDADVTRSATETPLPAPPDRRHGAPLLPPVIAYAVLTVAAAIVPMLIAGHAAWSSDSALLDVYQHHHGAARAQALLTTAAAIPLAVLSAIFCDRIKTCGVDAPGRVIALIGGAVSAALLATSGLISLALLGEHTATSLPLLQFGQRLATALGGTGFAAFTGLLVAGISITGLLGRILPKPLALTGVVAAVVGELALLTILTDAADPLLPLARFASLIVLIAAAITMRPQVT
jgi:hypothetical protein